VDTVAELGVWIRNVVGNEALVDRFPACAAIVRAERSDGRNSDVKAVGIVRHLQDCVQAQPASARLPGVAGIERAQSGKLTPGHAAIG